MKAFLCVIGGFLLMALLLVGLGVDTESVPAILYVVVWIIMTSCLTALLKGK